MMNLASLSYNSSGCSPIIIHSDLDFLFRTKGS